MEFIDTHTHLYLDKFSEDRDAVIQRALDNNIKRMYLPNIDQSSIDDMLALEEEYPEHCFAMMGLHPCSVGPDHRKQLAIVEEWLGRRPFKAVGEIGMDLYWDKTYRSEQEDAFRIQAGWAMDRGLPIVIHSRETIDMLIDLMREIDDDRLFGIFHCFTGTAAQAKAIIDLGFVLGIGGIATFKNTGLDQTLANVPLNKLVLETDSPYLAPVPFRGKRNESSYLIKVAEKLAAIYGLGLDEVARITTDNAKKIFERTGTA